MRVSGLWRAAAASNGQYHGFPERAPVQAELCRILRAVNLAADGDFSSETCYTCWAKDRTASEGANRVEPWEGTDGLLCSAVLAVCFFLHADDDPVAICTERGEGHPWASTSSCTLGDPWPVCYLPTWLLHTW